MADTRLGRRSLLKRLGAAAIAAPFMTGGFGGLATGMGRRGGVFSQPARAQVGGAGFAKRLILFFTPNGTVHKHLWPSGGETDFTFAPGSILEPLAPHKDQLIILDGIDFYGTSNHEGGMSHMLTGGGGAGTVTGGASLDQFVAKQIAAPTPFPSLELGVQTSAWGGSVQTRMCYASEGQFAPPDDDPFHVYNRLFADAGEAEPQQLTKAQIRRKSVIDLVKGELGSIQKGVGTLEANKLEAHLDALRSAEKQLVAVGACASPEPTVAANLNANENFPAIAKAQMDMMVTALACDLTRVASLQLTHTVSPTVFTWLGMSEGHHSLSHIDDSNPTGIAHFVDCERWFAEQFAYLLGSLAALPEPGADGTMLDHSAVLWCQELGDGRLHECVSVPMVIAGKAGGFFETGRYLQLGSEPHNKLLVSMCHAMGLDNPTFGDPSHGTGGLPGLA